MLVMTANNRCPTVLQWARRYPGAVGNLFAPPRFARPRADCLLPYALDNGAYSSWRNGTTWNGDAFLALIGRAVACSQRPLWVVVPDVVGNRLATLERWRDWAPRCRTYGLPLAFAVQDGMTPEDVPAGADVVFVGGTTAWKRRHIALFCGAFPRVHVARINTREWLWHCHDAGAESIDGTGWFRGDRAQRRDLENYLAYAAGRAGSYRQIALEV